MLWSTKSPALLVVVVVVVVVVRDGARFRAGLRVANAEKKKEKESSFTLLSSICH
jgi:hypothetical protein